MYKKIGYYLLGMLLGGNAAFSQLSSVTAKFGGGPAANFMRYEQAFLGQGLGPQVSLGTAYKVSARDAFKVALVFDQRREYYTQLGLIMHGSTASARTEVVSRNNFMAVPLSYERTFGQGLYYWSIGTYSAYLLSNTRTYTDKETKTTRHNDLSRVHRLMWGLQTAVGIKIPAGARHRLILEFSPAYYASKDMAYLNLIAMLGFEFGLGKKDTLK
ncbi:MAG TPA: hypothetical protein VL947_01810 [Cytophagales bacterium]|nr:hypothetical protein [Cytophagales bacterium]